MTETYTPTLEDCERRCAIARRPVLSDDVWTNTAQDWLRVYGFAGFNVKKIVMAAIKLKGSREGRIAGPTVERAFDAVTGHTSSEVSIKRARR